MTETRTIVAIAAPLILLGGPLLLGLAGLSGTRRAAPAAAPAPDWRLAAASALLYALAFNLVFFIQELFLVVPKALTPGLRPTLFHNNHDWEGDNPFAHLFQGAGALAIFITAIALWLLLTFRPPASAAGRLLLLWMVFHGFFQSLPQVVLGAVFPPNDVGMAMEFLELTPAAKSVAALTALALIAVIGTQLIRPMLDLAPRPVRNRTLFIFRTATLPALMALPLIVLFRVPGSIDQVAVVPVAVTVIGISWLQAGAWRVMPSGTVGASPVRSIRIPLVAVLILLILFQGVLRPGIAFY